MYINTKTNQYPYTLEQLIQDNPNTSFPDVISVAALSGYSLQQVSTCDKPPHDAVTHTVIESAPVNIAGEWHQQWQIVELDAKTQEDNLALLVKNIGKQVQKRLDAFAQERGYDNIMSACSYATSTDPVFAREGTYCIQLRDTTWRAFYNNFTQDIREYNEIEPLLPLAEWP